MKATEAKSVVLLHHHLKALRLPTVAAECEKVAHRAAADNVDHLTYLLQLTELELLEREKRAADRRLKAAKFPTLKSLENFDFAARPSVNKMLIAELARCEYIERRENLLMIGNPGTGKSHLATALAAEACARGYKVRFYRTTELVTALIEARNELSFLRLKAQLAKLDLLVLDELGYVPASKVGAELLFDVISTAYERTSLIVTSNLPFELWTEVLGSERLTGATLDRLTHRCRIIETKGESYRLADAKSRHRRPRAKHDDAAAEEADTTDDESVAGEALTTTAEPAADAVAAPVDNPQPAK
jgi:DNA replication protein DnaC